MDETAQASLRTQEALRNPFYEEWAAQNKKKQEALRESSPLQ